MLHQSHIIQGKEMIAICCEMLEADLKRVVVVNYNGQPIYDKFVGSLGSYKMIPITGREVQCDSLQNVQRDVADILEDKYIIGHNLPIVWEALNISDYGRYSIKDLTVLDGQAATLKDLASLFLLRDIDIDGYCPGQNALAAMDIFKKL